VSETKKHYFKPPKNIKNLSDAELDKWAEEIIDFLIEKDKENK
jgi:deoxyxylulose-5-phosphate synthase